MKCRAINCEALVRAGGFCGKHYIQFKRASDPDLKSLEVVRTKAWKEKNKLLHSEQQARYRAKHSINLKEYYNKWLKRNWKSQMAYRQARKKRVRLATPKWADLKVIREFYQNCPKGYHVDHIIPLKGKNVSGLHVIGNLQYLPAMDNLKKSNKI